MSNANFHLCKAETYLKYNHLYRIITQWLSLKAQSFTHNMTTVHFMKLKCKQTTIFSSKSKRMDFYRNTIGHFSKGDWENGLVMFISLWFSMCKMKEISKLKK